ncbi:MAG: hypothetical protein LBH47_02380 [Christensenellaceae bacterium]|nr:hypothetical protein [Christensenellaceae bacterium]
MASFEAGICPDCKEYIWVKNNVPFLVCPLCGEKISLNDSINALEKKCNDASKVDEVVADCIALELKYGPQLPFSILCELCDNFPTRERPTYYLVRLSNYDRQVVYEYMKRFCEIKSEAGNVPWAEEFLKQVVVYRNMEFADKIEPYIRNKLPQDKQEVWLSKLEKLYKEYTDRSASPKSTSLLFAIYLASTVINVAILPLFLLTSIEILWTAALAIGIVLVEIGLMFWHNKVFGNRLSMTDRERLFMVIFLSSMFFAIGAGIVGGIPTWKIKL